MSRKERKTQRAVALGRARATSRTRIDALVEALAGTDPETRCMAALRTGRHGGADLVDPLRERILGDDLELSACCRVALAVLEQRLASTRTDPPPSLDALKADLISPYAVERRRAARSLARLPVAQAVPALLAALAAESDATVMGELLLSTGALDAAGQLPTLLPYFRHHDDRVRACALEACWGLPNVEVGHAALPLVKDGAPKVRAAGLVLLIRRAQDTSRAMAQTVVASQRTWMRLTALFALGGMLDPWARNIVIQQIRNPALPALVRAMAREAVALTGKATVAVTASADETVFTDLTRHLQPLPDAPSFQAALESADPLARVHGLQNAWRFPAAQVLPQLERQVGLETDSLVLATLVKALAKVGGSSQLAAIRGFLEHEDDRVRSNAVEALALAHEGPELRSILKNLLAEDEAARPRKQAAAQLFASDPAEAVAHFRALVMGTDAGARSGALSVITSVQDDRLIPVLSDALRDPRRELHAPVVAMLVRAHDWPAAGELLLRFRKGEVAGEVLGDEPVGLLMSDLNSQRSSDRIRAMGRLVGSTDLRVNTVLELNLTARDPEVAHEAARVLRERHRSFTLPQLYERLGNLYVAQTKNGELPVPQEVAAQLPLGEVAAGESLDPERLRWLGKALYGAFDDEQELDASLREVCLDVRSALEQLGSIMSPMTRPERSAAATAQMRRDAARAGVQIERDPEVEDAPPPSRAALKHVLALAAFFSVFALYLVGVGEEEAPAEGATTSVTAASTRLLDAMGLEANPERFRDRFRDRQISLTAKLVAATDSRNADLRSGTVVFRLRTARTAAIPAGLRIGQRCDLRGKVIELAPDGAIVVEGQLETGKES